MKLRLQLQHDEKDCASACMKMILSFYGKSTSINNLRISAGTDNSGTSGYGIIESARKNGLSCKGFSAPDKNILSTIPCPAIFHINRNQREHYVVVNKITSKKVCVYDPSEGINKINIEDFLKIWTGVFFLCRPEEDFSFDKKESAFSPYLSLLRKNAGLIWKIFGASLLLCFFGILFAFYFRFLVDDVLYSEIKSTLNLVSFCYFVLLIFQAVLSFARNQLSLLMGIKINLTLICEFYNHLLKLPLSFFTSRKTGEIVSRIRDTDHIRKVLSSTFVSILIDSVMIVIGAFFMVKIGGKLFIVSVIPVLIASMIVLIFARPLKALIRKTAVCEASKNSSLVETVNGISTIKALCTEAAAFRRNEILSVDLVRKTVQLDTLGNFNTTLHLLINGIGTLLIYWIGSAAIFEGTLTLGQLISFVTLSSFFLGPLSRLLTLQPAIQEAIVSAERLNDIFQMEEEDFDEKNNLETDNFSHTINFNQVSFAYGTRGNTINNLSLCIKKGEKIAITGASGSGKSTFIKLLMKFYKPSEGSIEIDDTNISFLKTKEYRNLFGYVPQENLLFSGTIAENIAWGLENFTPSMIHKAAKDAHALEFISKLPDGFRTIVGENGATLSGGERQRIALARVLIRNPQILVLDEATASLDSICEKSIMSVINELKDKTIIIIAHKLSTVTQCDRIYVMDKGSVIESGTHKELLSTKSKYKQLWESQYEK